MGEPLKPCPFCGGPAKSWRDPTDGPYIGCELCPANVNEDYQWNRRAPSPVVAEVVKRLRRLADVDDPYMPRVYGNELAELADRLEGGF